MTATSSRAKDAARESRAGERLLTAQAIESIVQFDGGGLPVLSVYVSVPVDPATRLAEKTRVKSLLHDVRELCDDVSLGHESRLSLREDVRRVEIAASADPWLPPAHAVFSCSNKGFFEEVVLPRRIRDRAMVGATPWVRPMRAVLDEFHRYCVVVIDSADASIWELYLGEIVEARRYHDPTLRKANYAGRHGLDEYHVRNRADRLVRSHFHHIAAELDELFRRDRYDLLIVGGPHDEVRRFLDFLSLDVRGRVAGTFGVDEDRLSLDEVRRHAEDVVELHERNEERSWVTDVYEKAARGGLAAIGLEQCLWAGSTAAIQRLLVQEDVVVPGVMCDASGWLSLSGDACPLCGGPTRPTADVVGELVEVVIDEGGSVEHVVAPTALADDIVAASLRFPLPPAPSAGAGTETARAPVGGDAAG